MKRERLETVIENIGKWHWVLKNVNGNIGKCNQKHWKMESETLENVIGNIGKCNWKHWKIHLKIGIRTWQWHQKIVLI